MNWVFGAQTELNNGAQALELGQLDDAAVAFRRFFARRQKSPGGRLSAADAEAAALAATCAALRGDALEAAAAHSILDKSHEASRHSYSAAREWANTCAHAARGDVEAALEGLQSGPPHRYAAWRPRVALAAAERAISTRPEAGVEHLQRLTDALGELGSQDIASFVLAAAACMSGNIPLTRRLLGSLKGKHALLVALRTLAATGGDKPAKLELSEQQSRAVGMFALRLFCDESPEAIRDWIDRYGDALSTDVKATLELLRAWAECKHGADLRLPASTPATRDLRGVIEASAEILKGNVERAAPIVDTVSDAIARSALRTLMNVEHPSKALEASQAADTWPARVARPVAAVVLSRLLRAGASTADLPKWLVARPMDAREMSVWAHFKLSSGEPAVALEVLKDMQADGAEDAQLRLATDAARLRVAIEHLAKGQWEAATKLVAEVSADSSEEAMDVRALAWFGAEAERLGARLVTVQDLADALSKVRAGASRAEHHHLSRVERASAAFRIRWLLTAGELDAADAVIATVDARDPEVLFLHGVSELLRGEKRETAIAKLRDAAEAGQAGAAVILADLDGEAAPEQRLKALEAIGSSGKHSFISEAKAAAYEGANRGLEAKRLVFDQVRRPNWNVPPDLAAMARNILTLEVPPHWTRKSDPLAGRPTPLYPESTVLDRWEVLCLRASRWLQTAKASDGLMAGALERLRAAAAARHLEAAREAEMQILDLMRK